MFCNVPSEAVIECRDVPHSIYELPLYLHEEKLDDIVCDRLGLPKKKPDLKAWQEFVWHVIDPSHETKIAVVGKYIELQDAYKSIAEAFIHSGAANQCKVKVFWIQSEEIDSSNAKEKLKQFDGILVAPGFGDRGIEGKIEAVKYARTEKVPFFGICLGMQCAVIEYARSVLNLADAHTTEINPNTSNPVIDLMDHQKKVTDKGGTMRLGAYSCQVEEDSKAFECYQKVNIKERHRHRYEFNNDYKEKLESAGMKTTGLNPESNLVEIIEVAEHPWFVGVQFHPEYKSTVASPQPLFVGFIAAAITYSKQH